MNEFGLIRNHTSAAAILPRRIIAFGATDGAVQQGGASSDPLIGISGPRGAAAAGERIDVYRDGIRDVEYGGGITQGDPITSDADGKAVAAAPAAGVAARIVGFAEVSGVSGDIGSVSIHLGQVQG